jgi:hypothetical protein
MAHRPAATLGDPVDARDLEVTALVAEREVVLCGEAMATARDHCVGPLRRPLDAGDVEEFWARVRAEVGAVLDGY